MSQESSNTAARPRSNDAWQFARDARQAAMTLFAQRSPEERQVLFGTDMSGFSSVTSRARVGPARRGQRS